MYGCCHLYSEVQDTFPLKGDTKKLFKVKIGDQRISPRRFPLRFGNNFAVSLGEEEFSTKNLSYCLQMLFS